MSRSDPGRNVRIFFICIFQKKYNSYVFKGSAVLKIYTEELMKRVVLKSVYEAFDYVMDHYYPNGLEELASRKDTYCVISIQDTHTEGFGFEFKKNLYCRDVLTLYFDDIAGPVDSAVLFDENMAESMIRFIEKNRDSETLLIHCFGGYSRSRAAAAFAVKMLGGNNSAYFVQGSPNMHVYDLLMKTYEKMHASLYS